MEVIRKVGEVAFASNGSATLEIPAAHAVQKLGIEFTGTLTCSGTSTSAGALQEDGVLNLLKKLELRENGSKHVAAVKGPLLYHARRLIGGSPDPLVQPTIAGGANSFRAQWWLDMDLVRCLAPQFTLFRAEKNGDSPGKVYLNFTFGDATGASTTADDLVDSASTFDRVTAGTFRVTTIEHQGIPYVGHRKVVNLHTKDLTGAAANSDLDIPLSLGNVYRRLYILVRDDSVRDNALVNQVSLKVDETTTVYEQTWTEGQAKNVDDYHLELASGLPPVTGLLVIDRDADGKLGQVIDSKGHSSLKLHFDHDSVTGTAGIEVMTEEIRMMPGGPAVR